MLSNREILEEEGISSVKIDTVLEGVDEALHAIFSSYDVEMTPEAEIVEVVQDATLAAVIELGTENYENLVDEQFDRLYEDFEDPESMSARSNLYWVLGRAYHESDLDALNQLSGAIVARNYAGGDS